MELVLPVKTGSMSPSSLRSALPSDTRHEMQLRFYLMPTVFNSRPAFGLTILVSLEKCICSAKFN
jgi:hypothetical protein